jgi:ArsR family transcriptional regulator, lead/cadmium/zinc/bismuth-responsive transcriptional repressor
MTGDLGYWVMHLVPGDRAHRRIIDGDRVCTAIEAIHDEPGLRSSAARFAVLADLTRLKVLLCIKAAGPISVSDLAVAADLNDDTTSQALRHLRASHAVTAERDGRVIRYQIADPLLDHLLDQAVAPAAI